MPPTGRQPTSTRTAMQHLGIVVVLFMMAMVSLLNIFGTRVAKQQFHEDSTKTVRLARDKLHTKVINFSTFDTSTIDPGDPGPKIALMFLTKGPMHNEPLWRAFLEAAGRLEYKFPPLEMEAVNLTKVVDGPLKDPLDSIPEEEYQGYKIQMAGGYRIKKRKKPKPNEKLSKSGLGEKKLCPRESEMMDAEVERILSEESLSGSAILAGQSLFSVYTHTQPDNVFPSKSLFHGTQVSNPVNTTNAFAQFALVEASVVLLKAALDDPRNQRFVMLSESCIPIHSPDVVYLQLMSETLSRVGACKGRRRRDIYRWQSSMETAQLNRNHWRKSSQWFEVSRGHAELIVNDHHVREKFKRHCYTVGKRICIPDEHYIPTLLASYNLDWQSDCKGHVTSSLWTKGWHPRTYTTEEIDGDLLRKLQSVENPECNVDVTRQSTSLLFDGIGQGCVGGEKEFDGKWAGKWGYDNRILDKGFKFLEYDCPMFGRKFSPDTVNATLRAALSCRGAALGSWC